VSLGILTAVTIASGTLSLGEKNAFNAKKVQLETLDDTDVDTDTETDESCCDLEEGEAQQREQAFRNEEREQHAQAIKDKKVEDEHVSTISDTVCANQEEPDECKKEIIKEVTIRNDSTWEWPDLFTRIRRFRFSERLEI
jgi:hypothetical protein